MLHLQFPAAALRVPLPRLPSMRRLHGPPLPLGQQLRRLLHPEALHLVLRLWHHHYGLRLCSHDQALHSDALRPRLSGNDQRDDRSGRSHFDHELARVSVYPDSALRLNRGGSKPLDCD